MKTYTVIFLLIVSIKTNSQIRYHSSFGMGGGISKKLYEQNGEVEKSLPRGTFNIGISNQYYFSDWFGISLDLEYLNLNDKIQRSSFFMFCGDNQYNLDEAYVYRNEGFFLINFGPEVSFPPNSRIFFRPVFYTSFVLHQSTKLFDNDIKINQNNDIFSNQKFDYGLQFKFGYRNLGQRKLYWEISSETQLGLKSNENYEPIFNCTLADGPFPYKYFSSVIKLSIGYYY